MDRGEIWWADLDAPLGRRPVLILTRSAAVPVRDQVVVAQVTRTVHGILCEVPLDLADGMPKPCVVNCDVLLTVRKSRLHSRITALSSAKLADVEKALKFAMEIP
jgi:mRNA interferase MazF